MTIDYVCSKKGCGCMNYYLMYDGYNIQLRCRDNNHYIRHIDKKSYKDLIKFDNVEDRTGFDGGPIRANNGNNSMSINDFLDGLKEINAQQKQLEKEKLNAKPKSIKQRQNYNKYKQNKSSVKGKSTKTKKITDPNNPNRVYLPSARRWVDIKC